MAFPRFYLQHFLKVVKKKVQSVYLVYFLYLGVKLGIRKICISLLKC